MRLNKRLFLPGELGFGSLGSLGWLRNGAGGGGGGGGGVAVAWKSGSGGGGGGGGATHGIGVASEDIWFVLLVVVAECPWLNKIWKILDFRFIIVYLKLNGAFWANCTIFIRGRKVN